MRKYYERALRRIQMDIESLLLDPEPQHKALMEAFKAAEVCMTALANLPVEGSDPYDQLKPETRQEIERLIAQDLGRSSI